ncbi:MAG: lysophospholipid acyltransferase family protein [Planctomycetota bacterium]
MTHDAPNIIDPRPRRLVVAPRGRVRRTWTTLALSIVARSAVAGVFGTSREALTGGEWLESHLLRGNRPVIFVCWHNAIIGAVRFLQRYVATRGQYVCPVASPSRDGNAITAVLEDFAWHVEVIRGSSKRRGDEAMAGLQAAVEAGRSPVLTVDGPRGPRYESKPGAVRLAHLTGAPIVPFTWAARRELHLLSSWDGFRIPLPGGEVRYLVGPPLWVPRDAGEHALPFWIARLDQRLAGLTALADRYTAAGVRGVGRDRGRHRVTALDAELAAKAAAAATRQSP